ncbi:MAG: hypothetical protein EA382_00610 [Spirochaetaceae bacterium]|nr:MAG: hypothetical protein EA382_00610 [Spirochaetaceae bacterium]
MFAGLLASADFLAERLSLLSFLPRMTGNSILVVVTGAVTLLVGVAKLIFPAPGEAVPIAGDLLPALTGILVGALLILLGSDKAEESTPDAAKRFVSVVISYRIVIGLISVAVGLIHFIFPATVIL